MSSRKSPCCLNANSNYEDGHDEDYTISRYRPPNPKNILLAVDVSSQRLDLYSRYRQNGNEYEIAESFFNELAVIEDRLDYYAKQARAFGYSGLSVVMEPSGRYKKKLTW